MKILSLVMSTALIAKKKKKKRDQKTRRKSALYAWDAIRAHQSVITRQMAGRNYTAAGRWQC
jgi:hypothetical protein